MFAAAPIEQYGTAWLPEPLLLHEGLFLSTYRVEATAEPGDGDSTDPATTMAAMTRPNRKRGRLPTRVHVERSLVTGTSPLLRSRRLTVVIQRPVGVPDNRRMA